MTHTTQAPTTGEGAMTKEPPGHAIGVAVVSAAIIIMVAVILGAWAFVLHLLGVL